MSSTSARYAVVALFLITGILGVLGPAHGSVGIIDGDGPYIHPGNPYAMIETGKGDIILELYPEHAPATVANFQKLADSDFYGDMIFHRVIDDFVIQTGDPTGTGWGGSDETIPLEISEALPHVDGAIGMARDSDPDSASSQFYICDGPQHGLNGSYAVYGITAYGLEVVRDIASVDTWVADRPVDGVSLDSVTVVSSDEIGGWIPAHSEPSPAWLNYLGVELISDDKPQEEGRSWLPVVGGLTLGLLVSWYLYRAGWFGR